MNVSWNPVSGMTTSMISTALAMLMSTGGIKHHATARLRLSSSSAGNPGIYPREGERSRFSYVKGSLRKGIPIPIRPLDQSAEAVRMAYRKKAQKAHPDKGGSESEFSQIH